MATKKILKAYDNIETGLTTNIALLKKRNPSIKNIEDGEIKEVLRMYRSEAFSIGKPVRPVKNFRSYKAERVGELIHCDLMTLNTKNNTNQSIKIKDYKYLLVMVDTYSRMTFAQLLENKTAKNVNAAVDRIVQKINEIYFNGSIHPRFVILVDGGGEFKAPPLNKNYRYFISNNKWGAVIAEYAIYRIRNKIRKISEKITEKTIEKIIINMNTSLNSNLSDKYTPENIFYDMKIPEKELNIIRERPSSLQPGDVVRLVNYFDKKGTFVKRSAYSNYTEKIFAILSIELDKIQNIWQYKLISMGNNYVLDRLWYKEELVKVHDSVKKLLDDDKIYELETFSNEEKKFYKIRESNEKDFKKE